MTRKLIEIKFSSASELARRALQRGAQIKANLESAVAETVLFGVTRIAMDTPVDTGRLRASIAGALDVVDLSGPKVKASEVAAGKKASLTRLNTAALEGAIGTNVEYAPHVEFGHRVVVRVGGKKKALRDGKGRVRRVAGRAMFRKNIPAIRKLFQQRCREAVQKGLRGEPMGGES